MHNVFHVTDWKKTDKLTNEVIVLTLPRNIHNVVFSFRPVMYFCLTQNLKQCILKLGV